jgi:hypothetical protein
LRAHAALAAQRAAFLVALTRPEPIGFGAGGHVRGALFLELTALHEAANTYQRKRETKANN